MLLLGVVICVVVGIWFRFSGSVAAVAFVDVVAATAAVMSRRSQL